MMDLVYAACAFIAGGAVMMFAAVLAPLIGLGGAPGALVHLRGERSGSTWLRSTGSVLCLVGQSYVALLLTAVVAESVRSLATGVGFPITVAVMWFMGWMIANGPVWAATKDAQTAAQPTVQYVMVSISGWVPAVAYWPLVLWPGLAPWLGAGWVPHL